MSERDLVHVLNSLWRRSDEAPAVAVQVGQIDEDIGRARGDMRTPLNLRSLEDRELVTALDDDSWALTPEGVAWIRQDAELSGG